MAAIKYTLSKDTSKRAPSIEAEAEWLNKRRFLWYELNVKPKRADAGDWVYFIRSGFMVARAKAVKFRYVKKNELDGTYTGAPAEKDCVRVKVQRPMQIALRPLRHSGFQGFRYVTAQELSTFEDAFKIRRRQRA